MNKIYTEFYFLAVIKETGKNDNEIVQFHYDQRNGIILPQNDQHEIGANHDLEVKQSPSP